MIGHGTGCDELDRVGRLLEKERRFTRRVRTHFARVDGVVAADAINSPYRKLLIAADHGNGGVGEGEKGFSYRYSLLLEARILPARQRGGRAGFHYFAAISVAHGNAPLNIF